MGMIDRSIATALIILLGFAFLPLPYAYYMFLRILVTASFAYLCWKRSTSQRSGVAWLFGVAAAIYNPFMPLHLGRELWTVVNLVTIVLSTYILFSKTAAIGVSDDDDIK